MRRYIAFIISMMLISSLLTAANRNSYMLNQDHRLSRWYALRLEGEITGCPTRALNRTCQSH